MAQHPVLEGWLQSSNHLIQEATKFTFSCLQHPVGLHEELSYVIPICFSTASDEHQR